MARIILIENGRLKGDIPLIGDSIRIGRERSSQVCIEEPKVSRYHAEIYRRNDVYILEDKKSTNGTRLNGKLVTEKTVLDHKDRISIGEVVLIFEHEGADSAGLVRPDSFDTTATVYDLLKYK